MIRILQIVSIVVVCMLGLKKPNKKYCKKLYVIILLCIFFSLYAILVTIQNDINYVMFRYFFNFICFLFVSYWGLTMLKNKEHVITIGRILDIWLYSSMIQMVISLLMFIYNDFFIFMNSIQHLSYGMISRLDLAEYRLMGLGNSFFGAGFNYGIDLLALVMLPYLNGSRIYNNKKLYILLLLMVLFVGILSARTFVVSIVLAALLFFWYNRNDLVRFVFKCLGLFIFIFTSYGLLGRLFSSTSKDFEKVHDWAFELFLVYGETGSLRTSSSDKTLSMYVFPDTIETWMFGDGLMNYVDGSFYMHTDVGIIRLIFYWGILMTLLFFFFQFKIVKYIIMYSGNKEFGIGILAIFVLLVLCNFKGLVTADLFFALMVIYVTYFSGKSQEKVLPVDF